MKIGSGSAGLNKLGVSEERLKELVRQNGPMVDDVKKALGK